MALQTALFPGEKANMDSTKEERTCTTLSFLEIWTTGFRWLLELMMIVLHKATSTETLMFPYYCIDLIKGL